MYTEINELKGLELLLRSDHKMSELDIKFHMRLFEGIFEIGYKKGRQDELLSNLIGSENAEMS